MKLVKTLLLNNRFCVHAKNYEDCILVFHLNEEERELDSVGVYTY